MYEIEIRLASILIIAFVLNFVWEYFHSKLYIAYRGAPITLPILLRAALFDAVCITVLSFFNVNIWLAVAIAFLFAVGLEIFALKTNRWKYKNNMPIIPFLGVGLTPVIQLPLLYYATVMNVVS